MCAVAGPIHCAICCRLRLISVEHRGAVQNPPGILSYVSDAVLIIQVGPAESAIVSANRQADIAVEIVEQVPQQKSRVGSQNAVRDGADPENPRRPKARRKLAVVAPVLQIQRVGVAERLARNLPDTQRRDRRAVSRLCAADLRSHPDNCSPSPRFQGTRRAADRKNQLPR